MQHKLEMERKERDREIVEKFRARRLRKIEKRKKSELLRMPTISEDGIEEEKVSQ